MTPYLIRSPFSLVIPEGRSRESVVSFGPLFRNDGSPTETLGDDGKKNNKKAVIKIGVIRNWRPAGFQDLLLGLFVVSLFNKVILEGFCPESVVFLFFNNNRSWTTTFQDDGNR